MKRCFLIPMFVAPLFLTGCDSEKLIVEGKAKVGFVYESSLLLGRSNRAYTISSSSHVEVYSTLIVTHDYVKDLELESRSKLVSLT